MKSIIGRSLAIVPPVAGTVVMGAISSTGGAAPPQPPGVRPACTSSWPVVESSSVTYNGAYYGTINLLYDSCSRDVKAQIVNAPVANGFSITAEVIRMNVGDVAYCTVFAGSSCTSDSASDAGVTSKAEGVNNQPGFTAYGFTSFY